MNLLDDIYDKMKKVGLSNLEQFIENYDLNANSVITTETLLFIAYDIYKYKPSVKLLENRLVRQHQKKFRKQLEERYGCCIITQDDKDMCQACHIIPFADSDHTNKYNVNNGLLLTASLHVLFDKHLLSVNAKGMVILSKKMLLGKTYENYHKYHKMQLKLCVETLMNLSTHYNTFIELEELINQ